MTRDRRRGRILLVTMLCTFAAVRLWLQVSPDTDLMVGRWNIHHLFTGIVLIVLGGVPLAIVPGRSRWLDAATAAFGAGLALALDEWVYLIATDGTNASYLRPVRSASRANSGRTLTIAATASASHCRTAVRKRALLGWDPLRVRASRPARLACVVFVIGSAANLPTTEMRGETSGRSPRPSSALDFRQRDCPETGPARNA